MKFFGLFVSLKSFLFPQNEIVKADRLTGRSQTK